MAQSYLIKGEINDGEQLYWSNSDGWVNKESATVFKDITTLPIGNTGTEYITRNLIAEMFNIDKVKEQIANCPPDEILILCNLWSINGPRYQEDCHEQQDYDWQEFEKELDVTLMVNDYDDLVIDVHGILSI